MKLEGFGVQLETLTEETAELVRQWRNRPEVLSQMEYREHISKEAQGLWFQNLRNEESLYFLILASTGPENAKREPVGMIHLAKTRKAETAECGLFIGNPDFSGTGITLGASLLLLDYAFENLRLNSVTAKVKNTNVGAQQYNRLLGFEKEMPVNADFTEWRLTKERYGGKRERLVLFL